MIILDYTKDSFINDVKNNVIEKKLQDKFHELGIGCSPSEISSWRNSLTQMRNIIDVGSINKDIHIALEYMPNSYNKRIDFMIMGEDDKNHRNYLVIELKQWEVARDTGQCDVVNTYVGGSNKDQLHPSYQASEYVHMIDAFNTNVQKLHIRGYACSYMFNASKDKNQNLTNENLYECVKQYPVFFRSDVKTVTDFVTKLTINGNGKQILIDIEEGKVVPSKKLIKVAHSILKGNNEYMLVDNQKLCYESIMSKVNDKNNVFIINGNPGTGKSVLAINLLTSLIKQKKNVRFVAPNSSFRNTLIEGILKSATKEDKKYFKLLFSGSSGFVTTAHDAYDWIVVDEAHRLHGKGTYMYRGISQIDDVLKASKNTIFFVDENQLIRPNDIGTIKNIKDNTLALNKTIYQGDQYHLEAQFRCLGQNGYINAVMNALQIESTANHYLNDNQHYEFQIVDDPNELRTLINEYNNGAQTARILAGYAYKWITNNIKDLDTLHTSYDVEIPTYNFKMPWNLREASMTWMSRETSIHEVGCIHTAQGLELDYAGIIIGKDLTIDENNNLIANKDNYYDLAGKKRLDNQNLTKYIKNIYFVLLTRAQKGTFVFIEDPKLKEYFKKFVKK